MAEASAMIKREIEDRLLSKHDLVKSNLHLLDDGFRVSWENHEGAAYEAEICPMWYDQYHTRSGALEWRSGCVRQDHQDHTGCGLFTHFAMWYQYQRACFY